MMMMSFSSLGLVSVIYVLWGYSMSFASAHTGESDILGIFDNPFALFGLTDLLTTGPGSTAQPPMCRAVSALCPPSSGWRSSSPSPSSPSP